MTVNQPGDHTAVSHGADSTRAPRTRDISDNVETLRDALLETYRGPHVDAAETSAETSAETAAETDVDIADTESPRHTQPREVIDDTALIAQLELGSQRGTGETKVAFVPGPDGALLIVTDQSAMLMDSVIVLMHRLGAAYTAIMNPDFRVERDEAGQLRRFEAAPYSQNTDDNIETWIHIQLAPAMDRKAVAQVEELIPRVLSDSRQVAADSDAMAAELSQLAQTLHGDGADRRDVAELLRWLADGNFVLLGYQRCPVSDGRSSVEESSRLGVLRWRNEVLPELTGDGELLVLAQATTPTYLRYGAYPYVVVVRDRTAHSSVEHRFVGLFTMAAMNDNVLGIPLISRRVHEALALAGKDPGRPAQLLLDVIQTVPRAELFALSAQQLHDMAVTVIDLGSRRRTLLFARVDKLGHFVTCLVYLPRDRYTTAVRLEMQDILVREFGGTGIEYSARVSESPWALVYFTVKLPEGTHPRGVDVSVENTTRIQELLTQAARTWGDRLLGAVLHDAIDLPTAQHYATALPEAYRQFVTPTGAIAHIRIIEGLDDDGVQLVFAGDTDTRIHQLTWYLGGRSASLSELLPMLQCMGVVVLDERPFRVTRPDGLSVWIYQFRISPHPTVPAARPDEIDDVAVRFADAVTAIWRGAAEIDRFNELVLRAGLTWQQVVIIRSYAKYLRQAGFPRSQAHIESVMNENAHTARSLIELYEAIFDPATDTGTSDTAKSRAAQAAASAVAADIDALVSLDTDRVLRAFASLVQATLRTNYFVTTEDSARSQGVLAIKLDPGLIDELPLPRPEFEIFVYSPRVEGVHLRFGAVARGGLRWSDRHEDFRTEVLGLVKAQAVKNAVIVPVGAKGGFVVKQPPLPTGDAAADRDATRTEGVACYRLFIAGLLDLTDNVDTTTGAVVAPPQVVRRDGEDSYLVVAADKGTATFSDVANEVAKSYGFWLGDAFASGGSVGYDHKAMGITAKGAWESVKRHFREMGLDTQTQDFTVVGIGDMSGDVFGNGMLLSEHIGLVAAFNHLHIFVDPEPDAARSLVERQRLFDLPRSSSASIAGS